MAASEKLRIQRGIGNRHGDGPGMQICKTSLYPNQIIRTRQDQQIQIAAEFSRAV